MHQPHILAGEEGSVVDASASVSVADTSAFSVSAAFMKSSGALATGSDCSLRHWKRSNVAGGDTFVSLPLPEEQETSDLGGSEYMARSGSMHDGSTHSCIPSQYVPPRPLPPTCFFNLFDLSEPYLILQCLHLEAI